MKKNKLTMVLSRLSGGVILLFSLALAVSSCKESIDDGNFAIKTEQTVSDYLADAPEKFSDIKAIFDRVRLGRSDEASTLTSVLSARGNYTLFAPNNEAVSKYIKGLGISSIDELTYDQAELIAKSCIIDNGELSAYEEATFPSPSGSFAEPNLNDRILSCTQDTTADGKMYYVINGGSKVLKTNNEVSNGMIHEVDSVIAPSTDNLYEMIASADNMQIFAHLLEQTTWADSLAVPYIDMDYENEEREAVFYPAFGTQAGLPYDVPMHRYIGFTAFVEPDDVFASEWGITLNKDAEGNVTNWAEVMAKFKQKCEAAYGTDAADDLSSPDNAINRFVAYHLLDGRIAYDRFVGHYNEYLYDFGADRARPQSINYPTNVWDYFTTLGKYRGLIKITQVSDRSLDPNTNALDHPIYINRKSVHKNGRQEDYQELRAEVPGILVSALNGNNDNNSMNGFYFPIDKVLLYDDATRSQLASERIRIEATTMLPEMLTNNMRLNSMGSFPRGYFKNIPNMSAGTIMTYLSCTHDRLSGGNGWRDYQGDEFLFLGLFDFTLRLPPFPKDGTYELRMGLSNNPKRGMAQIYFGEDPNRLTPTGLPVDMRQSAGSVAIPWFTDVDGDDITNAENDKNMRNQGYMKAPKYICWTNRQPTNTIRTSSGAIRMIVTTADMKANKTYYLRFKSALKKMDGEFFIDYFEYVPTSVYNGTTAEDIW